ncbi:hypothetical protein HXX76_010445 [Chlamydomonas incerta]|uniref:Uncharacterized protein n=1 Tax=Chlamydomonas incerta TaxID=51695 RepID=A0A835SWV8_CHLIN|nr:hypothetical protein HXX76_010445 [Chlamydomonas incerta]|eukprot:KAG2428295.1 hypothetical protein HXX76_010445 [Chlamydomonas incerta]
MSQPWPGAAFVAHWGRPEPWSALPRWQRLRLLCLAASSRHSSSLDAALTHCGTVITADALASAAAVGDLQACRRLHETEGCEGCRQDNRLVGTAAGLSGSLPVCGWLADATPDNKQAELLQSFLLPAAIFAGHERVVEWALERLGNDHNQSGAWVGAAAKAGRLELMQRLAARYPFDLWAQQGQPMVLSRVAFGCPLAVLQQYYEPWGTGLLGNPWQRRYLLLAAAASPTPDWAEKCAWLCAQWGTAAAAFGTRIAELRRRRLVDGWEVADAMQHTDFPQRLQLLASRGLGPDLERHAPWAAGIVGSTAALEFCLDQLPGTAAGRVVQVAAGGPPPAQNPAAQQRISERMELIAPGAVEHGHVPVLRLLRGRGFVFRDRHLRAALGDAAFGKTKVYHVQDSGLASLRYLLLEEPAGLAPGGGAAADWSCLFRDVAVGGADLPLLRHLHEQHGAAIDLVAVAQGGSEEALSWAVAALEAAGQAPQPLSGNDLWDVLSSGNWAAADWLVRHGLAPTKQELLRHMLFEDPGRTRVPDLQWVVGVRGGQDRSQAQVQWTAELHAALKAAWTFYESLARDVSISGIPVESTGARRQLGRGADIGNETPGRLRWLAELVEAVGAELAGAAGGAPGAGGAQ